MWRHWDERGGIWVYTDSLVRELLKQDSHNEYLLFVPPGATPDIHGPNLRLVEIAARTRLGWDQLAVPAAAARERVDVVFNPKLSVPVRGRFLRAFALHGMEQFACASSYPVLDRVYVHSTMPLYCRRADAIFCPTEQVKSDIVKWLHARPDKVYVAPYGLADPFLGDVTAADLARVRERHDLPASFVLFVGGLTPLKNLSTMLRAFARVRSEVPHDFVLSGFNRWGDTSELGLIDELGLSDRVRQIGWVEAADQPALYRMASALLLPSLYEGFGFPVAEAMAMGCPVLTSRRGSLPDVAGDAALVLDDPTDVAAMAASLRRLLTDAEWASALIERGYRRSREFRWARVAGLVRSTFESLAARARVA